MARRGPIAGSPTSETVARQSWSDASRTTALQVSACRPGSKGAPRDRLAPGFSTRRAAVALGLWAAWYAAYRFYYAFGGHLGMIGLPAPAAHFRRDNFVGGTIILVAAVLPSAAVRAWRHGLVRGLVPVVGWIAAVGCCMHALTLLTLRVLSLTGVHYIHYPPGLWLSLHRHEADLQDVFFNEPWFFIEGCLRGLFALTARQPLLTAAMATLRGCGVRARGSLRRVERARRHPDVSIRLEKAQVVERSIRRSCRPAACSEPRRSRRRQRNPPSPRTREPK